jgi:hypothetical protein
VGLQDITATTWSAAPGGPGTSTAPVANKSDSNDAAATAVPKLYTVAPTSLTQSGVLRSETLVSMANAAFSFIGNTILWEFGNGRPARCPVLRGTSQYLAISASQALAGQSVDWEIEWTEE